MYSDALRLSFQYRDIFLLAFTFLHSNLLNFIKNLSIHDYHNLMCSLRTQKEEEWFLKIFTQMHRL